eukprot:gnl/TRDRNA2_/TRDRNA2_191863_c0_seq1.p1 gnl/TRDRNA2_/TRDRNA2_191863_c0~~gnl/TRDRNA2_/TRDRNA2_191863_c0_seq1.p1  ORF type:complete len:890 (-),score=120.50 gnl/TRDRNA2_/TRDRNA2_191863_c0_seq1:226-2562(-)
MRPAAPQLLGRSASPVSVGLVRPPSQTLSGISSVNGPGAPLPSSRGRTSVDPSRGNTLLSLDMPRLRLSECKTQPGEGDTLASPVRAASPAARQTAPLTSSYMAPTVVRQASFSPPRTSVGMSPLHSRPSLSPVRSQNSLEHNISPIAMAMRGARAGAAARAAAASAVGSQPLMSPTKGRVSSVRRQQSTVASTGPPPVVALGSVDAPGRQSIGGGGSVTAAPAGSSITAAAPRIGSGPTSVKIPGLSSSAATSQTPVPLLSPTHNERFSSGLSGFSAALDSSNPTAGSARQPVLNFPASMPSRPLRQISTAALHSSQAPDGTDVIGTLLTAPTPSLPSRSPVGSPAPSGTLSSPKAPPLRRSSSPSPLRSSTLRSHTASTPYLGATVAAAPPPRQIQHTWAPGEQDPSFSPQVPLRTTSGWRAAVAIAFGITPSISPAASPAPSSVRRLTSEPRLSLPVRQSSSASEHLGPVPPLPHTKDQQAKSSSAPVVVTLDDHTGQPPSPEEAESSVDSPTILDRPSPRGPIEAELPPDIAEPAAAPATAEAAAAAVADTEVVTAATVELAEVPAAAEPVAAEGERAVARSPAAIVEATVSSAESTPAMRTRLCPRSGTEPSHAVVEPGPKPSPVENGTVVSAVAAGTPASEQPVNGHVTEDADKPQQADAGDDDTDTDASDGGGLPDGVTKRRLRGERPLQLNFRPGVPRLCLPPPGVGTVGSPFGEATNLVDGGGGAGAPRQVVGSESTHKVATVGVAGAPRVAGEVTHHVAAAPALRLVR